MCKLSIEKLQADTQMVTDFVQKACKTEWLSLVGKSLESAFSIAANLEHENGNCFIYCRSGVEQTQIFTSLVQVICDQHYRTYAGLRVLVHKEWNYYQYDF